MVDYAFCPTVREADLMSGKKGELPFRLVTTGLGEWMC
jgi:hypothetical protein